MAPLKNIKPVILIAVALAVFNSCKAQYADLEDGIYAEFITTKGSMLAKLTYEKTPATVANFIALVEGKHPLVDSMYKKKNYYNGTTFHRVMNNFMIQGGDQEGTGSGNPGYKFDDEFDSTLRHNKPGILSMANSGPNTNGSQFYITEKPTPWLDGYDAEGNLKKCDQPRVSCHSVFGELVKGLEVQDSISNVKTDSKNKPIEDVIVNEINIIRVGKAARKFNAPKVFLDSFKEAERLKKEKVERAAAILKATKDKFAKQREQVTALPSGLQYVITEKGTGVKLPLSAKILTHYAVYFEDGKLLETSSLEIAEALDIVDETRKSKNGYEPITADISPDAQMIPGFKEGLQQLSVGDKATLFIPYHLAYGESGNRGIPPKSNIIFEVEIIELIK